MLVSDHGVDEFGVEGYRMHGTSADGNEPFVLFYNPKLAPKAEIRIDVVDVASTISLFFDGVDIPTNSLGVTHTYLGNVVSLEANTHSEWTTGENQTELDIKLLKQNLVQLSKAAESRGVSVDREELQKLMSLPKSDRKNIKWVNC